VRPDAPVRPHLMMFGACRAPSPLGYSAAQPVLSDEYIWRIAPSRWAGAKVVGRAGGLNCADLGRLSTARYQHRFHQLCIGTCILGMQSKCE
jgi:hypothetical protein